MTTPDDLDGLVERLEAYTISSFTPFTLREAAAAIIRLREERDSARSEASHVAKMFMRQRDVLLEVRDKIADEGDRCYFGSTNQADDLRAVVQELDNYAWDRYMRAVKWPDYIEASRKAHARAEAAEAELAKAREACADLGDVLPVMARAHDRIHCLPRATDTELADALERAIPKVRRARAIMEEGRE